MFTLLRRCIIWMIPAMLACVQLQAQNPIANENALPGNPQWEWDVSASGDPSIQGFSTDMSVNKGNTVRFKVRITGTNKNFSIRIYRLGYYQGNGARLIANLGTVTGTSQPSPNVDASIGLMDYGNWSVTASWQVPSNAVTGIYIALLQRQDNGGSSHIYFIVRDDGSSAPILFKTSDATWQAYNSYGGYSFYGGSTGNISGRADKLSYNRPFNTRSVKPECFLFNAEYPMLRWLERNGYDMAYVTDVDLERTTTPITTANRQVLLSVGHDEYWSQNMRNVYENARNAGVHLAFFSGNEVYWKTRWENNNRTLVCYKEGYNGQGEYNCGGNCDPVGGVWTGRWRNGCEFGEDGCRPENALTGQLSWTESSLAMQVPSDYKNLPFWRNTSIANLQPGQVATLTDQTLGYEWNYEQSDYAWANPQGRVTMSRTTFNGMTHMLSLYTHSSGAIVFGAGTVQWSWGLDDVHDRGNPAPSRDMQQATANLFIDMGVLPATPQEDLVVPAPPSPPSGTNYAIFTNQLPTNQNQRDNTLGIVVGTRFRSNTAGSVTAFRFYKGAGNTGTHIGQLWTNTGTLLGQATFTNETASGWQQVNLANPISISANVDYIVSYHSSQGYYSTTGRFFLNSVVNGPLTAPADATGRRNGLYKYSATPIFPDETYEQENYFVDVVFSPPAPQDGTPPTVTSIAPAQGATGISTGTSVTADFSEALDPSRVNGTNAFLRAGASTIAASVSYSSASNRITIAPSSSLSGGVTYTVTLKGGSTGIRDVAGNALANDYTWSFTTVSAPVQSGTCPCTVFNTSQAVQPSSSIAKNDGSPLNIGMKFIPSQNGFVTALRFYKSINHSGTHTGQLYNANGTLLASAVFTNETASGWQQVNLSTAVAVTAGTTYIVSYHSAEGNYSTTVGYFDASVVSGPLTAPSTGSSGGNGLYLYGATPAMPVSSYNASNYWVDAVFTESTQGDQTAPTVTSTSPASGATGVSQGVTISAFFSESLSASTVNGTNVFIRNGATAVPATVGYTSGSQQLTLAPSSALLAGTTYTVTLKGGASGIKDAAGNALAADYTWSFTTATVPVQPGICPCTVFNTSQAVQPTSSVAKNDGSPLNIGMKFIPSQNGFVTALRFYKSINHSGTHTGQLYNANGTLLASTVFTNETASGWQQVNLSTPVAVTAGTTYIVSYHSAQGNYSTTVGYFDASVVSGLLTAPSTGSSGGNGVYLYSAAPAMPVSSYNSSNYWVDVVFNTTVAGAASTQLSGTAMTDEEAPASRPGVVRNRNADFSLAQNIPNPASAFTTIRYSIPESGRVSISLHDMHGRLVRQMVNAQKPAGTYTVELDTRTLSKGVYYYQMVSGTHHSVRRLVIE
ncbi:MAG: DUF4082 domain-containing protein [Chitinophagaceae bacterium]|nr:DUF4082 domain-containing protein [Chitinophagaceae bacterium]